MVDQRIIEYAERMEQIGLAIQAEVTKLEEAEVPESSIRTAGEMAELKGKFAEWLDKLKKHQETLDGISPPYRAAYEHVLLKLHFKKYVQATEQIVASLDAVKVSVDRAVYEQGVARQQAAAREMAQISKQLTVALLSE